MNRILKASICLMVIEFDMVRTEIGDLCPVCPLCLLVFKVNKTTLTQHHTPVWLPFVCIVDFHDYLCIVK